MTRESLLAEALRLNSDERLQLVEDLWDSISEVPDAVALTAEQVALLESRLKAHRTDPAGASDWEEVKARLFK
jgi:putative addiction module component (TIGR02574 family)